MTVGRADRWIEAGFKGIAKSGAEGVRLEVFAKNRIERGPRERAQLIARSAEKLLDNPV